MKCDLHTHTYHSDGSYTPKELVAAAKEKNLIIALTDHNTVSGLPDFLSEAERVGVTAIGGSELTTVYKGREFHLVGLFIKPEHYEELETMCHRFLHLKQESNIDLVNKLCDMGYKLDFNRIKSRNVKGNVNRAHIAAELVENGYVSSVKEAFDTLLDEKCGYYIPAERLELCDGIAFLHSIGAVSILAHPLKELSYDQLRQLLREIKDARLMAIETMHSSYTDEDIAVSKEIAKEFGLLESGGSDFHGLVKPDVELGVGKGNIDISEEYYQKLLNSI